MAWSKLRRITVMMPAAMGLAALLAAALLAGAAELAQPAPLAEATTRWKLPEEASESRPAKRQIPVHIGMHVLRLTSLDITNNQFSLDFWLWFRWKDDGIKPYARFELTNGKVDFSHVERVDKVGEENYACVRVQATMSCFWNVERFPLSRQKLTIEIEDDDLDADQLVYVADCENCGVDGNFRVAGWRLDGFSSQAIQHDYTTNYGDPRYPARKNTYFSRALFSIDLGRSDIFHSFKIFGGLYLAALVAFTVFFVKPDHRLGLTVGAIFAAVASHTVVASYLPDAGVLTLADKLHLVTAILILISLFETAYALRLMHSNREAAYKRMDRVTFWVIAPLFVVSNVWLFAQK